MVYNHVMSADDFCINKLVPGYFPVSMKTVRIQTAQDVEMIQHPRETWCGNILWIPYATGQMYLNTIRDLLSSERHIRHFGYLHQRM